MTMDGQDKEEYDPKHLECRPATAEDFEGVININRHVYVKYDYLYGKYMEYFHNSAFKQFVAVYRNEIVSYACVAWVKKDEVLWAMSARTIPRFQAFGISHQVRIYAVQYLNFNLPFTRFSTLMYDGFRPKSNQKVLMKWNILAYEVSSKDLNRNINKMVGILDKPLPYDTPLNDIVGMLQNTECIEALRQYEPLVHWPGNDWICYEITTENIVKMVKSYPTFVTMEVKEKRIDAISNYSTCLQLEGALNLAFHYMGQADISLWKRHMAKCVLHFIQSIKEHLVLRVEFHFPETISSKEAATFLQPTFGEESTDFVMKKAVVIDEFL